MTSVHPYILSNYFSPSRIFFINRATHCINGGGGGGGGGGNLHHALTFLSFVESLINVYP